MNIWLEEARVFLKEEISFWLQILRNKTMLQTVASLGLNIICNHYLTVRVFHI